MTEREKFERKFPLPERCEWSDALSQYCWVYTSAAHPHENFWDVWQEAIAQSPQVPEGMALVPLDGFVIEKGSDEYKEVIVTGPDLEMQTFWPDDAAYGLVKAMLPTKGAS